MRIFIVWGKEAFDHPYPDDDDIDLLKPMSFCRCSFFLLVLDDDLHLP